MSKKLNQIMRELKHHVPFTLSATLISILIVVLLKFVFAVNISETLFEIFHPLHIIASAIVTSALFYKYKKNFIYAVSVGVLGAIIVGSLSDIIFPYIGGRMLFSKIAFHLPLFETPFFILGSAIFGGLIGVIGGWTKLPHFVHIFLSAFASLFYLLAFSPVLNFVYFVFAFLIVFIAVIIPCCLSDIVFPFLFLGENIKKRAC